MARRTTEGKGKKIMLKQNELPELQKQLGTTDPRRIMRHLKKNNMYPSQRAKAALNLK